MQAEIIGESRSRFAHWVFVCNAAIKNIGHFDLCLLLTLLLLAFYPPHYSYISFPLSLIAIAGIIFPFLRQNRKIWIVASALIFFGNFMNWHVADNHKFLLGYWCLAILFSLYTTQPAQSLEKIARWMIALVFLFAVTQKTLSGDYLSSSFFYYEMLFDRRFNNLAQYVGGITDEIKELNQSARRALVNYDSILTSVQLRSAGNINILAKFVTWWNYLIQIMIGLVFLLPGNYTLSKYKDTFLLLFLFTTYLFAPVIGFGWVLAIMGIAQLKQDAVNRLFLYLLAFITLQAYKIPWIKLFSIFIS